jgi:RNA polymerase sigma-70 factor, ECF subfamily
MTLRERMLLRRLRERDERAFREMVAEHRDRVFNLTYRMLGNRAEAEDVAQEVFIKVFKTIDTFREEAKLSTWLYKVTLNTCRNQIKHLARRHDREQDELDEAIEPRAAAGAGAPPSSPRPDHALERVQTQAMLERAIAELDEDHRELVVLRDVEDLSIEEIHEITGLPDGTIKSRLHRARLALRKKLQRQMP